MSFMSSKADSHNHISYNKKFTAWPTFQKNKVWILTGWLIRFRPLILAYACIWYWPMC